MMPNDFKYIVIGGGLAGCYALDGIRSQDPKGSALLISSEDHLPYDRPPLTKKLWFGKKKVEDIFIHDSKHFADNGIEVLLNTRAETVDARNKTVTCGNGAVYRYEKLLLATGGAPRRLDIEGGRLEELYYYRYLDDFLRLRSQVGPQTRALVIGGGFIGSEIAAALNINKADVTMLMHGPYPVDKVFPESLGRAIQQDYVRRGVKIVSHDSPVSITKSGSTFFTRTHSGNSIGADVVIVGVGIEPEMRLAKQAGLAVENGVIVNEFLQSSHPDIYAAGDNAFFPYQALGIRTRVEHWDNAVNQGKTAGMNMVGAGVPYTYMPYFFSDLFDFGYEAVGLISSKLRTVADWQEENRTGIIYYLEDSTVKGAMMCNVWEKVDEARQWIKSARHIDVPVHV
ncbi:MAG: FAD-dependent oxidoreductase [Planctomycetaceae bacterium]|nr:FAD-dependent oxidoreductase [Planctomycetaceae bacterium]